MTVAAPLAGEPSIRAFRTSKIHAAGSLELSLVPLIAGALATIAPGEVVSIP